ncbi:MAG: hypothetical protein WEE89_06780 [Gemmatimonadota bacterium]
MGLPRRAGGQDHQHAGDSRLSWSWGAQAIGLLTHATPAVAGRSLTEGYLTQPNLFLHASAGPAMLMATFNFEGLTLDRGELNAGTWGEGYVDRRHPHTYVHEAMASLRGSLAGANWSVSAGKGFAPFGTDDPMSRPFVKFPANHHLAQVLERLVAVGAVRGGAFLIEGGLFNGDEPVTPKSLGQLDRFGDSWSVRLTAYPMAGLELQASHALVESPEQPEGSALDQRKLSVSVRLERSNGNGGHYLMGEWARTGELSDGTEVIVLPSVLVEGSVRRGNWRAGARLERTIRPEEERVDGIFRSPWPHADERNWGMTRWVIATVNVSRTIDLAALRATPLLEVGRQWGNPTEQPAFFAPEDLMGSDKLWSVSLGVRLTAGKPHTRMGRYGVAAQ